MFEVLKTEDRPAQEESCPLPTFISVGRGPTADTQVTDYIPSFFVSKGIDCMVRSMVPKYRLDPNLMFYGDCGRVRL